MFVYQAMEQALDQYVVRGLGNNITFLRSVMRNKKFKSGDYNTKFIAEQYPNGFKGVILNDKESRELVAATALVHLMRFYGTHEGGVDSSSEYYISLYLILLFLYSTYFITFLYLLCLATSLWLFFPRDLIEPLLSPT